MGKADWLTGHIRAVIECCVLVSVYSIQFCNHVTYQHFSDFEKVSTLAVPC